jgi:hypothetical protein
MNIEILVRRAIEHIKSKWGLPETGFIAGGSISNLVWEYVSGKPAVINDVDVFIFDGVMESLDEYTDRSSLFRYAEKQNKYFEDYVGLKFNSITKDFYTIVESKTDGIFNKIRFNSNKSETDIILRSFDINCTRVGYSIDEDKVYWQPEFEEFLNTGKLQVCNLMTPSHTGIRIVKKKHELDCQLDNFEIDLIRFCLNWKFSDTIKLRFKKRYYDLYQKYSQYLDPFFVIKREQDVEDFILLNYNEKTEIYQLYAKVEQDLSEKFVPQDNIFDDVNFSGIHSSQDFLFYMRNIWRKPELSELWSKLYYFFSDNSYIDCQPTEEELDLIHRLSKYAPKSIENLKGLKLSEQIKLVKSVVELYEDDPIVAISLLEKHKLSEVELEAQNLLLLELSVRREIVNDTKNKVRNILKINKYNDGNSPCETPF